MSGGDTVKASYSMELRVSLDGAPAELAGRLELGAVDLDASKGLRSVAGEAEGEGAAGGAALARMLVGSALAFVEKELVEDALRKFPGARVVERRRPYVLNTAAGVVEIAVHDLKIGAAAVFTTSAGFFEEKNGRHNYETPGFIKWCAQLATKTSYRNSAQILGDMASEPGFVSHETLRNNTEAQGAEIKRELEKMAKEIFLKNGMNEKGEIIPRKATGGKDSADPAKEPEVADSMDQAKELEVADSMDQAKESEVADSADPVKEPDVAYSLDPAKEAAAVEEQKPKATRERVLDAAKRLKVNLSEEEILDYEDPETSVNISIDEIMTVKQAETRSNNPEKGRRHYAKVVNAHIQWKKLSYIITSSAIDLALTLVMAFLYNSGIAGLQLVFFTDGAKNLGGPIRSTLKRFSVKLILDWHHVVKKLNERLSMAISTKEQRMDLVKELKWYLWRGRAVDAVRSLRALPAEKVRNKTVLNELIAWIECRMDTIPNYEMRRMLGLRNSSNLVEGVNAAVVAHRQKKNGMSWSPEGSCALAAIAAVVRNGELDGWASARKLRFTFNKAS
jgi:hypothetical protein